MRKKSVLTLGPYWAFGCLLFIGLTAAAQPWRSGATEGKDADTTTVPELRSNHLLSISDPSVNYIVALVDSEPITNHDVRQVIARLRDQTGISDRPQIPNHLAHDALDLLIFERSQLQWAERIGVSVSDYDVRSMVATIAGRNQISVTDFYRELDRQGVDRQRFIQNLREQQTLQRLREREVPRRINITEVEIDQYLAQSKAAQAQGGGRIELAQILIPVAENSNSEQQATARQTALKWQQDIAQGADFFEMARQHSQSPDRLTGGRMGLLAPERYPELFLEATRNAPVGGVVGPLRSDAGFHLLKVVERQPTGGLSIGQLRVRHILLRPDDKLGPDAAHAKLLQFKRDIVQKQADFAQLARDHSQDGSASSGGELGWVSPGQMVPEFEQVIAKLGIGEISEPLVSRFGIHLIQVLEQREVRLDARQERDYARKILRQEKYDLALDTWAKEVRGKAFIEYREPPQ